MLVTQKRRISAGQTSATRRFSIAPALSLTQQGVVNHQAIVMSSRSSNALFLFDTLLRTQSVVFVDSVDSSTAKSIHYRKRRATEEAWAALGQKQPQVAHTLLTKEEGLIDEISPPIIYELVSQLVATEADKSLMVIPHYIAACSRRDLKPVGLMKILDQVCRYIHTMKTPHHDRICKNLQAIFSSLGPVARRACFERMLLGLLHQREHNGFLLASKLYMSSNHELLSNPNFLTSLLHTSTFQSASKFPFVDVLERLTRLDQALLPSSCVSLLQLFYPHSDTWLSHRLLRCIIDISESAGLEQSLCGLDTSTLEALASAAIRSSDLQLGFRLWEYIEVTSCRVDEGTLESLTLLFCQRPETYAKAFELLHFIQERGFAPSRALIRDMSSYFRYVTRLQ